MLSFHVSFFFSSFVQIVDKTFKDLVSYSFSRLLISSVVIIHCLPIRRDIESETLVYHSSELNCIISLRTFVVSDLAFGFLKLNLVLLDYFEEKSHKLLIVKEIGILNFLDSFRPHQRFNKLVYDFGCLLERLLELHFSIVGLDDLDVFKPTLGYFVYFGDHFLLRDDDSLNHYIRPKLLSSR